MKVKSKSFFAKPSTDLRKSVSLEQAFKGKSEKQKLREQHQAIVTQPPTKVKVNISGNLRGMHNKENPPTSEQMKVRRAMRKLWNKKMPSLQCSNCQLSAQCPQYKPGYVCAFEPFLNSHSIQDERDLMEYMKDLLSEGVKRAQQTLLMERLSGAKPSLETTEALAYLFNQMLQLHERMLKQDAVSLEIESTDGTIIGNLFGNLEGLIGVTKESHEKYIDSPMHSGETKLIENTPVEELPVVHANAELLRDFALENKNNVTGSESTPPKQSARPIQEEL
jgi:hypothetical protein